MKHFILIISFVLSVTQFKSQCFQIQSILVDACAGSQEGQNEMVTFQVGSTALNTANLSVNWPNNSWLGLTQNAGTAADVAAVNATINGCGLLKEPLAGVLPVNSKVLLVTSTAWSPLAQSFVNLNDTLYIIFQTAGNTNGHFANYQAGGGLRTLTITFSSPTSCTDAVTYDRALLTNQAGNVGGQDGGAAEFTAIGIPTYVNYGCQAPFIPLSVDAGNSKTICIVATQNFSATTSGAYTSVNWSLSSGATGTFVPTNSLSTTYTPGLGETGTVKLYCTIIKSCGTQTTTVKDSVNLTILQIADPVISATSNAICSGSTSTLSYSLTNAANTGTTSVLWSPGSATTSTISVNTANIYTVQITNTCGSKIATVSITSIPSPSVTLSVNSLTACTGNTVALSASSNTGNFNWSNPVSTNSAVVVSANTTTTGVVTTTNVCGTDAQTYTLTVVQIPTLSISNVNVSLCSGQTTTINATSSEGNYLWSPGSTTTNTLLVNSAGIYTVSTSNNCFTTAATTSVTINSTPTLSISSTSSSLCANGQTATLSLSGSTGTYSWSDGSSASVLIVNTPGVYTATVTTPSCGSTTSSFTVNAIVTPTISLTSSSSLLCNGASATLTASNNMFNEIWSNGSINTPTIIVGSAGTYTVGVSNACGSPTAAVTIQSNSTPVLNLSSNLSNLCPNETATLTVTGGSAPYSWSNSPSTGSVVTSSGGTITVSNTNVCGTNTSSIVINVSNLNASISATPVSGVKPLVVDFTNNSNGATTYAWDFGNGNAATTQTVSSQTYTATGTYTVYLIVSDGFCFDTDSVIIDVFNEEPWLIIPNVFTPNNDSVNDVFKVKGFNVKEFDCTIFNRWGLQLFSWDDINKGWDGKSDGKESTDGTYFYMINAKDIDNKEIKKQGYFQLFK